MSHHSSSVAPRSPKNTNSGNWMTPSGRSLVSSSPSVGLIKRMCTPRLSELLTRNTGHTGARPNSSAASFTARISSVTAMSLNTAGRMTPF